MIPLRISGATRYLGAPDGWEPDANGPCAYLAIRDGYTSPGRFAIMVSAWEPTPDELVALNAGARVTLTMAGTAHPPVMLSVDYPSPTTRTEVAP